MYDLLHAHLRRSKFVSFTGSSESGQLMSDHSPAHLHFRHSKNHKILQTAEAFEIVIRRADVSEIQAHQKLVKAEQRQLLSGAIIYGASS